MSGMARAELVLTLALTSLGRVPRRPRAAFPGTPQSGHAVVTVADDGTLLAETGRGPILLVLASDAVIRGLHGPLDLGDVRSGDLLEWNADDERPVVMVDELRVTPRGLHGT